MMYAGCPQCFRRVEAESLQETIRIWNYMQEPVVKDSLTVKEKGEKS